MSRHRYIVSYDVREPTRLRRTHRAILGFGDPLQYSVFVCDLSATELVSLEIELRKILRLSEDSLLLVDLGPLPGLAERRMRILGQQRLPEVKRFLIV